MSHELRSPLNAILGFAQLMEFRFAAANARAEGQHRPDSPGGMVSAGADQRNPRSGADRVRQAVAVAGTDVAGRSHARMPGHDRAAGAKEGHQHDLPRVRHPLLCRCRPDPGEAGSDQPSFQRDQIQPAERNGGRGMRRERPDSAFASASGTPAQDCLRTCWSSCSSRSTVSDRSAARRKAPASAWW